MTTSQMMRIEDRFVDPVVAEHRLWLQTYDELTLISGSGFTREGKQLPLTEDQEVAYRAIPDVLDKLEETWAMMDASVRPAHYLTSV